MLLKDPFSGYPDINGTKFVLITGKIYLEIGYVFLVIKEFQAAIENQELTD